MIWLFILLEGYNHYFGKGKRKRKYHFWLINSYITPTRRQSFHFPIQYIMVPLRFYFNQRILFMQARLTHQPFEGMRRILDASLRCVESSASKLSCFCFSHEVEEPCLEKVGPCNYFPRKKEVLIAICVYVMWMYWNSSSSNR